MVNVVAVFQDFWTSSAYYSYSNFGNFNIEEFFWNNGDSVIFRDRMRNLQDITLPVLFGGVEPGVIIYKTSKGKEKIGGYVGHLFNSFARRHNARLNASSLTTSISSYAIHNLILNGTIEMSGGTLSIKDDSIKWFSYPYTEFDWGVMLPIEPRIPIYKVFAFVIEWKTFISIILVWKLLSVLLETALKFSGRYRNYSLRNLFFNIDCFRGILGEPFSEAPNASFTTKLIYLLIFLLGMMILTSYEAFLKSFMTHPPRQSFIKSFDDLQLSGLKIYILQADIDGVLIKQRPNLIKKYSNIQNMHLKLQKSNGKLLQINKITLIDSYFVGLKN
ncbi:uncharacterized protein LOC129918084 [Episyrphus balteatus]|uniref:uncharacterized protein LOC129918084 n=1 Tax=Episyrphus balteatus TaxID=286459 RepID=UPI0024858F4B|nr:uncharacterized protein LOC129918084 [Episyrphus balteatus]